MVDIVTRATELAGYMQGIIHTLLVRKKSQVLTNKLNYEKTETH